MSPREVCLQENLENHVFPQKMAMLLMMVIVMIMKKNLK